MSVCCLRLETCRTIVNKLTRAKLIIFFVVKLYKSFLLLFLFTTQARCLQTHHRFNNCLQFYPFLLYPLARMLCIPSLWHFSSSPLLQQTVIPGIRSCAPCLQTWKTNFNMLNQVRCLPSSCLAGVHSSKFLVTLQHLKPSTVPAHLTIFIVLKPFQAAMRAFF